MNNLIIQLKRRNVFRVAIVYAIVGWLLMQLATQLEGSLNLPAWFDTFVTVIVLIGLPVALILAWAFELTPDGVKPTAVVKDGESIAPQTGKKLNGILIGLLAVAVGVIGWQALGGNNKAETSATLAGPIAAEDQSIAVLPFVALSTDENDTFFGKGIAEELLNSLAQFPELKVAARTSAFSYEGQNVDLRDVGETLGVAHVLEGSVRRSGEKLRITAQLIRTSDGFHLWSDTYDRKMTDVFEIQDEIVAELSQVLQFRLGVGAGVGRASSAKTSPQTYESYLKGLDMWWHREADVNRREAIATFLGVTEQDPNFADGWAAYGVSMVLSGFDDSQHLSVKEHPAAVEAALDRAMELEPDNVRALAGRVAFHVFGRTDVEKAKTALGKALVLAPNDAFVQYMAAQYAHLVGDDGATSRAMQRSLGDDPLHTTKQRIAFKMQNTQGILDVNHTHIRRIQAEIDACSAAKTCSRNNILGAQTHFMESAIQAGSTDDIAIASAMLEKAYQGRNPTAKMTEGEFNCIKKFNTYYIENEGPAPAEDTNCIFENEYFEVFGLMNVSWLARLGHHGRALDTLFDPAIVNKGLGSGPVNLWPLTESRFEMPDSIRRHPKYHEWWARPGFPELAAARLANGKTAGLPLPIAE